MLGELASLTKAIPHQGMKVEVTPSHQEEQEGNEIVYSRVELFLKPRNSYPQLISESVGSTKADAEQKASKLALDYFKNRGVEPDISKDYLMFCD